MKQDYLPHYLKKNKISVPIKSGSELLEISKKHPELKLKFGCTRGECGICAIKVLSGDENLSKRSKIESKTLKQKKLDPSWRLACQCAINGSVEIS